VYSGEVVPNRESAIIISNHVTAIDWCFIFPLAMRRGRLGCLKWFAKQSVKYIPGFGWGIYAMDSVFLTRDWTKDKEHIERTFSNIKTRQLPFWLISYLEGTRLAPEKVLESQEWCKANGKPILKNTIFPRTKGFVATVQALRSVADAVYDVTITFPQKPSAFSLLSNIALRRGCEIHIHVRRWPTTALPEEPEAIADWCVQRWVEKDNLLQHWKDNDCKFPASHTEPFIREPMWLRNHLNECRAKKE